MADPNDNGKCGKAPPPQPSFIPEDVVAQIKIVLTKQNQCLLFGPINDPDNLPMVLDMLANGVKIVAELQRALGEPRRVVPFSGPLPPGVNLRG